MTRLRALLIAAALWAAIYLPGLGSTEIKGEEGRRILPAVTMLDGGGWLIPRVGGKPFLRKPPLVNWLIAASFKITGTRNEWTARLPSALCVLALAATIIATSGAPGWMDPATALVAAIFSITQLGLLAKARFVGAEIEGIYAPLTGIAITLWLAFRLGKKSPWLTWLASFLFLGLACLAKGPSLHLLFFYAVVAATLAAERDLRALLHPAHLAGIALAAAIFAAWAFPFFHSPEAVAAAAVWKRQGIDRFTDSDFNPTNYLLNIPRALADQLPWLIFAPFLILFRLRCSPKIAPPVTLSPPSPALSPINISPAFLPIASGNLLTPRLLKFLTLTTAATALIVLLIPGALPRYILPLGAPIALLLAFSLCLHFNSQPENPIAARWHLTNRILAALLIIAALAAPFTVAPNRHSFDTDASIFSSAIPVAKIGLLCGLLLAICALIIARRPHSLTLPGLTITSATLLAVASILYALAIVPILNRRDDLRPFGVSITAEIPSGKSLTIFDPGYLPAIFYIRAPYRYATELDQISPAADFILIRDQERKKFATRLPEFQIAKTFAQKDHHDVLLLHRTAPITNHPPP